MITSKQNDTCPGKQSVFWNEDLVILWLLSCSVTYLSTFPTLQWNPVYTRVSEPLSSLPFCISHLLPGNIPMCVQGSSMDSLGEDSLLFRTWTAPGILCVCLFPYLSRACSGTSIKRRRGRSDQHYLIVLSQFYQIMLWKQNVPALCNC